MRYRWLGLAVVLGVTALLYGPSLHGPFLFDDFPNLAALTSIDHLSSWRDLGIYLSQLRGFPGRPLAMLSFLLQKSAWPDHPFPFRLVNLGIHLFNGILVYLLALRLGRTWLAQSGVYPDSRQRATLAALLAAAAWLLNPIQLSGVALVVQRMTLLMALFVMLGLLAYLRGLLAEHARPWKRAAWMLLGLGLCMLLAFLCKENGILLPLYALLLDATLLRDQVRRLPKALGYWRRLLIWPVTLFVLGYLLWAIPVQLGQQGIRDFTLGQRLLTEPRILFDYLGKIFLPRFGLYGLYHDGYRISRGLFSPWTTLPALLTLLAMVSAAFAGLRRWPLFALGVLWYLGGQLIESSSIMLELYFEHRNYMPLFGIVLALALAIASIRDHARQRMVLALAGLWLAACGITTTLSARTYASADTLALTWANTQPQSIRSQIFLANQLYQHGQINTTLKVIDKAETRYPQHASLAEARVVYECMRGTLDKGRLKHLDNLLAHAAFDRGGFANMKALRKVATTHQCTVLTPARWLQMVDTLLANPAYAHDGIATGFLHYQKHLWAVSVGNLGMAIDELDQAYSHDPSANIPRLKAKYLASAGLYDQAIAALRNTDYTRLPRLRRWLVNDRAINAEAIAKIATMKHKAEAKKKHTPPAIIPAPKMSH